MFVSSQTGLAKVFLDDDKLPVLEPMDRKKDAAGNSVQEATNTSLFNQVVVSFSQPQWQEIVKVWGIETAAITKPQGLSWTMVPRYYVDSTFFHA